MRELEHRQVRVVERDRDDASPAGAATASVKVAPR